ncbi:MAG: protein-disulfide reductase DsbD family protein [Candidatus Kapabacteria bacterium]|jgi:thiol:disulfide interchange protein DsbD|nr:protein-disulfide reductase DsbD family protein [Candidatus Kapabacteria bacterium]
MYLPAKGNQVKDGNKLVKTQLLSEMDIVSSGTDFLIGIKVIPDNGWHTYWINPGDAGLPTVVELKLPENVRSSDVIWEVPDKIPFAGMANYGYEKEHILLIPIHIDDNFNADELLIEANISWLVCKEECIPGSRKQSLKLPVKSQAVRNQQIVELFDNLQNRHCKINEDLKFQAVKTNNEELKLNIYLPDYLKDLKNLEFYPIEAGFFDNGYKQSLSINGSKAELSLKLDKYRENNPTEVFGILVSDENLFPTANGKAVIVKAQIED